MSTYADAVLQAVVTRRSASRLEAPAPSLGELEELVTAAATAPDHGRLRPWRLIPLLGESRELLGSAMAEAAPTPEHARRAEQGPLRAPLLVTIVACPRRDHPKVPEWEQLAATAAMVTMLSLLLHARGYGSIWRTGPHLQAPQVLKHLGIDEDAGEQLLGWLYVGTPAAAPASSRPSFDVSSRICLP